MFLEICSWKTNKSMWSKNAYPSNYCSSEEATTRHLSSSELMPRLKDRLAESHKFISWSKPKTKQRLWKTGVKYWNHFHVIINKVIYYTKRKRAINYERDYSMANAWSFFGSDNHIELVSIVSSIYKGKHNIKSTKQWEIQKGWR